MFSWNMKKRIGKKLVDALKRGEKELGWPGFDGFVFDNDKRAAKPWKDSYVYCIVGAYIDAVEYAEAQGIPLERMRLVHGEEIALKGRTLNGYDKDGSQKKFLVIGDAHMRGDYDDAMKAMIEMGFEVVNMSRENQEVEVKVDGVATGEKVKLTVAPSHWTE